jgi:hypothetical protein
MLHNPATPMFNFQQEIAQQQQHAHLQQPMPQQQMHNPNLFAPAPLAHNAFSPLPASLRIDTTSDFSMDFRHYPISAGTTASPSDYASPAFFTTGAPSSEPMQTNPAFQQNPYSLPFLDPMADHTNMTGPSMSPMSALSHGDPVIANQSPPLTGMHRSNSTDFLQMAHDASNLADDQLALSEMYSKQTLSLPMHSHSPGLEGPSDDLAMQSMVSFDALDASSLSPENSHL